MKGFALLALLVLTGSTVAVAKNKVSPPNSELLRTLLEQKLHSGVGPHSGIVIDVHHPNKPISHGWHYMDALYCGWEYNDGSPLFYAYDGNTVLWDTTNDHLLAVALAIPCGHGYKLGYFVVGAPANFIYNKTESFYYQ